MDISLDAQRGKWLKLHFIAVLLLMLYSVASTLEPYGFTLTFIRPHIVFCSAVFALYFYFRRLDTGIEARLILFFGIWLYITRALNRDILLIDDFNLVFDILFCYVILDTGMLLDKERRERLFDWISTACGVVFSVLAILALTVALRQASITISNAGWTVDMTGSKFQRLFVFGNNPNVCGIWFALAAMLMACQFIKCRHKLWRIPIALAIVLNYLALTLSFSRNCMLAFCVGCGLLAILAVMGWLRRSKKWLQILAGLAAAAVLMVAVYKSFDLAADLISQVTASLNSSTDTVQSDPGTDIDASSEESELPIYHDIRDLSKSVSNLSDRLPIYKSLFYSFGQEPKRLIIGCLDADVMTISNTVLPHDYAHLHNSYLQVFALTGLPGFLLIMAFFVLLVWRMVKLFFSENAGTQLWVKSLTAPLAGLLTYNLFETSMFHFFDFRGEMVFFLAGILLGYYYELYPTRRGDKQ